MPRSHNPRIPITSGPLKGYSIIGHDRRHQCPKCRARTYCKDCCVCERCGFTPAASRPS